MKNFEQQKKKCQSLQSFWSYDERSERLYQTISRSRPGKVIIHCGTNDVRDYSAKQVTNNLIHLKSLINEISPDTAVIFSTLTLRTDSTNLVNKVTEVNICLQNSCKKHNIELVDNSNNDKRGLSAKGLRRS